MTQWTFGVIYRGMGDQRHLHHQRGRPSIADAVPLGTPAQLEGSTTPMLLSQLLLLTGAGEGGVL